MRAIGSAADWLYLAFATAIVLGVFAQVYLIGSYFFGAGQGALDAHMSVGWTMHGLEVLVSSQRSSPGFHGVTSASRRCSPLIETVAGQPCQQHRSVGDCRPLLALVVLVLATTLALRAFRAAGAQPRA